MGSLSLRLSQLLRLSRCPHGSLLCSASHFTHFTATTFRASYLNYYTPLRFHSFQQLLAHRLPLFGSPAGRVGLRLNYFICLRFALAIKAVALCSRSSSWFLYYKNYKNPTFHFAHSCKGFSILQTISLHHPCSSRRRLAMLGQCPQTIPLRSIYCSHRPAVWLKAVPSCI